MLCDMKLNDLSPNITGYQVALERELDKYRVSIAGITNAQINGHGC